MTSVSCIDLEGPVVVLMCGVAGSGKTTYAQRLEAEGYVRLSIDEEIWHRFGRYGIDYDAADYPRLSRAAEKTVCEHLVGLVKQRRDVVIDLSLWQRSTRDQYKRLIEHAGGRWRLIYLRADPAVLRRRHDERNKRFDANAAFPITDELLADYLVSFEPPENEDEQIIDAIG